MADREALLARLREDRFAAHEELFRHRHEDPPALWHYELSECFWSDEPRIVILGFRGGAKSTFAEEHVVVAGLEGAFRCCVFIGPSETRAAERLGAVAAELRLNDLVLELWPDPLDAGGPQTQTKLTLKNGATILALGRGQDIRGLKQVSARPDLIIVDDFEDAENVLTPDGRRGMLRWFLRELRLACHPRARMRVLATIMHADCVPLQLVRAGWPVRYFPVAYVDAAGIEAPSWPARFPMSWIEAERTEYQRHGEADIWEMEMMCNAADDTSRDFRPEYFRVERRVRTYEPVYCMFDPARTVRNTSSATGIVVFSWVGNNLVVWEDRTGFYRPSELIEVMFDLEDRYHPVAIGFEEVGLEEWAREPIRAEAAKRGVFLPLQPLRAPRDKLAFIRGLEPHARGGDIVFATELPDLAGAFVGFPRGRIDGPNALAYALILRPGIPVYEDFLPAVHVAERIFWPRGEPLYLALNATGAWTTGALVGHANGRTVIIRDWIREGDPGWGAAEIVREAGLAAGARISVCLPPSHFDQWHNIGLVQAVAAIPAEVRQGAAETRGRDFLRRQLAHFSRDVAALRVAAEARWTLAALASGYARKPGKPEPEPGFYRTLMEGIESTLGLCATGVFDENATWSFTREGRRYRQYASAFEDRRVH